MPKLWKMRNLTLEETLLLTLFKDNDIDWKAIYILPRKTGYKIYLQSFHDKNLNNILFFLIRNCLILDLKRPPVVRFTTSLHLCFDRHIVKSLWTQTIIFEMILGFPF